MANITLFAQVIRLIPREIIQRLVKKHGTDKHAKGFNSWSHLVTMIFSQFSGSVSLRQISEGLQSATGNLNHLGLSRVPSKSNISYQNANRTSQFFEDVFYVLFQYWGQLQVVTLPDTTSQEILKDEEVRLTGVETASKYPKKIRRIGIYNVQGGYTIDLYTNDFKHAASTIAALYRSRWKIEIFFRNLKQNLHIKSFLGTSQNAVEIQIWTALITILLLQYLKRIAKHPWCLSNLTASLILNTFTKIDLLQWINEPFSPPPDEAEIA